jgi:hypothetical protein
MSEMNNNVVMAKETPKKNWGYRLFAVLLLAICAAVAAVLNIGAITTTAIGEPTSATLLTLVQDMLNNGNHVLGFIPSFVTGPVGTIYTLAFYLFMVGLIGAAIFALISIFTAKNAPVLVRTALFYFAAGTTLYTVAFSLAYGTYNAAQEFDLITLILAVVGMVLYFLFAAKKVGKVAGAYFLQAILSVAAAMLLALVIGKSAMLASEWEIVSTLGVAVMLISALISIGRMTKAGGIVFDLVRYFLVLIVSLLVVAKTGAEALGIIAAIIVVLQIIIAIIQLIKSKKANEDVIREEAAQQATSGFHTEEYAEAYAYEGGPVAGVLMAEEVNPSFLPHEPHVTTAGYDFYNCKSFDPFIATLDMAERNEFTELFILKFKGTMPELPDYEVGGDNKEFFRKVFIYLGQYRDRMSQTLLMKMYQFSMKI